MSELIQKHDNRATIRWKLLTGASALALTAYVSSASVANAEDAGRPQVWIELGAQLERASGGDGPFIADFYSRLDPSFTSPGKFQSELPWAFGPEAKVSFQPKDSNWVFSAAIRYGRASNQRSDQQKAAEVKLYDYIAPAGVPGPGIFGRDCCIRYAVTPSKVDFADVQTSHQESHLVLDFNVGKDVGLGLFGRDSSSVISAGVRFAQFQTRSDVSVKARTDLEHANVFTALPTFALIHALYPQKYALGTHFRAYSLDAGSARNFKGIGPSLSWDASATLAGSPDSSELTFDWGINAALLFGKQKTKTHHQSLGSYAALRYGQVHYQSPTSHTPAPQSRSRNVTVPNVGGMAGFSIKFPDAKISVGYRADIFFNAMDGGWDTAKKQNRSFIGPFASVSIGLGD